jgi:general secretion pathway protein G
MVEILGTGRHKIIGIVGLLVVGVIVSILFVANLGNGSTSIEEAKEGALQEDLWTMRSLIRDYTTDQHKRPESLNDLVAARYLKRLPKDPMTGRDDTWIVERSGDAGMPGITNVRSGASGTSRKGTRYADW